jgi:NodT family efflux transporter outer membrane factor (OMF) lipoprotein
MSNPRVHARALSRIFALSIALCTALSACSTGQVPPTTTELLTPPDRFKQAAYWDAKERAASSTPAATFVQVNSDWWRVFADPQLDQLQADLLAGNQDLKALAARVAQAHAALDAAQGRRSPTLSAALGGDRANAVGSGSAVRNTLSAGLAVDWEIDVWRRLGRAADAAQARAVASSHDLQAATLSAQATLTQTYLALRAAEAQQAVLARSIAVYIRSHELAQARYQSGVTAQTDVLQAQTQLRTAQIQHAEVQAQRALLAHALASLLGKPPSAFDLGDTAQLPPVPQVPRFLPADLLSRRPDIAASAERVKAAYADLGVTEAALLPALAFSGDVGYRGPGLSGLITGPHLVWSVGGSLLQTLLDGGVRKAATRQARAAADEATAQLRQVALDALVEVEDNLVLSAQLGTQTSLQREALDFARRNLQITEDQYRVGTVSYVNVVLAQATALSAERNLLDLQTRQLAAAGQLLKNVAGHW